MLGHLCDRKVRTFQSNLSARNSRFKQGKPTDLLVSMCYLRACAWDHCWMARGFCMFLGEQSTHSTHCDHCGIFFRCLRFGQCSGAGSPQYLLETLSSGDAIPVLSFERGHEDRFWSQWMSHDLLAFMGGSWPQIIPALERFNFLGQWMARAHVISDLGFSPVSFHSVIYESLLAGHAVTPLPIPNEYQDRPSDVRAPKASDISASFATYFPAAHLLISHFSFLSFDFM